jgi:hypothetical protein
VYSGGIGQLATLNLCGTGRHLGHFPPELAQLSRTLTELDLSCNALGHVPVPVYALEGLVRLNLAYNDVRPPARDRERETVCVCVCEWECVCIHDAQREIRTHRHTEPRWCLFMCARVNAIVPVYLGCALTHTAVYLWAFMHVRVRARVCMCACMCMRAWVPVRVYLYVCVHVCMC